MSKVSVVLDEEQQTELQMIVIDRDEKEALRFLKEVIWAQVQTVRRHGVCGRPEQGPG
jgi:hypothetical protein